MVSSFWETHYSYTNSNNIIQAFDNNTLYKFFTETFPDYTHNRHTFMQISRYSLKIPSFTEADILKYSVYPISDEALQFHKLANPAQPNISLNQIDVNLVNIRGLITHKENKSAFLKSATLAQDNSLTFITETHLYKNTHFDAEILKYLPNYSIPRTDRNISSSNSENKQLSSGGGCMIITPPHLNCRKKVSYSNGNCELLITECPEIEASLINIYRPPHPNNSLKHFNEIIEKTRLYLLERNNTLPSYKTVLAGDFNFPHSIVEWCNSDEGIIPVPSPGNQEDKLAFQLLNDLTSEFDLTQRVGVPTRDNAILDLIFLDSGIQTSVCTSTPIPQGVCRFLKKNSPTFPDL